MSARRLGDLGRAERRRAMIRTLIRCAVAGIVIFGLYYVLPLRGGKTDVRELIRLIVGAVVFVVVMILNTRSILRSELPQLRAVETLAVAIPLFLVIFASSYTSLSYVHPNSFNQPLNRTESLYFTIVTLGTVGYGDLVPTSDFARVLVSVQILIDLVLLALIVRVIVDTTKRSLNPDNRDLPSDL